MSIKVPTTQELAESTIGEVEAALSQSTPLFAKAFLRVLAKVHAGIDILLFRYGAWIALQQFARFATAREVTIGGRRVKPLEELGELVGAGRPRPATRAVLVVEATVTSMTGEIPAGAQLTNKAGSVVYEVVAPVPLTAPKVSVVIRASSSTDGGDGSGPIGNLEVGDKVDFAQPFNVLTEATVTAVQVLGAPGEDIEREYRQRVMRRRARKPRGGSYADYQEWAEEVPGIVHAYPYAGAPGEVDVYVEATPESSGNPDGIPTGAQLAAVLESINRDVSGRATRRPVNAAVNVLPITRRAFNIVVTGLTPNTPEHRTAVADALSEHLLSREPWIEGLSTLPRLDRVTQAALSGVVDEVVDALGAQVTSVSVSPGPIFLLGHGEKAKLGDLVFN